MKKTILFTLVVGLVALVAEASFKRMPIDAKFPTQEVLQHQTITSPAASSTAYILSANAGGGASGTTVTTFLAQPDVARNLVLTPGGTTADVAAGNVVVTGRDAKGRVITETLALIANQSTATTGNKAFKTITSVQFPAEDSPYGASFSLGIGEKLGLNRCLNGTGYFIKGLVDGAVLTGETVAINATEMASNTVIPNPAANGSRVFDFLFIQNFRCDN